MSLDISTDRVFLPSGHLQDDSLWQLIELDVVNNPEKYPGYHDSILRSAGSIDFSIEEADAAKEHFSSCDACQHSASLLKLMTTATS